MSAASHSIPVAALLVLESALGPHFLRTMNTTSEDRWRDLRPDPDSDTPLYLQLARKLGNAIHDNRWNAGEALPSERVLSEALGYRESRRAKRSRCWSNKG